MTTQYIVEDSLEQAQTMSRVYWERILGHPKNPEDVSEFLGQCIENPIDSKGVIVMMQESYNDLYPLLTPAEKADAEAKLLPEDDPYIVAFLEAIKPPSNL